MIKTTTPSVEGKQIVAYHGVVTGEAILGANIFKDLFAGIRDIIGGRARMMGANAVVGIDIDYETIMGGGGGSMLMVSVSGTAVSLK